MARRPKKKNARPGRPADPSRGIVGFRLLKDLGPLLQTRADERLISRNKLVELVLCDYVSKPDRKLHVPRKLPQPEPADDRQINLFD